MDHLDKCVKQLIEKMILNSNSVDVYQEFINLYQEVRKRHLDKKLRTLKRRIDFPSKSITGIIRRRIRRINKTNR